MEVSIQTGRKTKKELFLECDIEELKNIIEERINAFKPDTYVKAWDRTNKYLNEKQYMEQCLPIKDFINSITEEYLKDKIQDFPKKANGFDLDKILTIKDINCCIHKQENDGHTWELYSLCIIALKKNRLELGIFPKSILGMK